MLSKTDAQASPNMEFSIFFHIRENMEAIHGSNMENMEWPGIWHQFYYQTNAVPAMYIPGCGIVELAV
jgi:hypothetical protein